MGLRPHNATTTGSRGRVAPDFAELTQGNKPEKSLTEHVPKTGGRNHYGRITSRFRSDGQKRYILCPDGLKVGDTVVSSRNADIKPGNNLPLRFIPLGTTVHNIELKISGGAQLCRSAGVGAQVMAKEGDWGQIRLPSGETRKVHLDCRATVGQVGNIEHASVHVGKAGRTRWKGRRPH